MMTSLPTAHDTALSDTGSDEWEAVMLNDKMLNDHSILSSLEEEAEKEDSSNEVKHPGLIWRFLLFHHGGPEGFLLFGVSSIWASMVQSPKGFLLFGGFLRGRVSSIWGGGLHASCK